MTKSGLLSSLKRIFASLIFILLLYIAYCAGASADMACPCEVVIEIPDYGCDD